MGQLQGCALDWPYAVKLDTSRNIARHVVDTVVNHAPGLTMQAVGTVTVTDPTPGETFVFVSPVATAED